MLDDNAITFFFDFITYFNMLLFVSALMKTLCSYHYVDFRFIPTVWQLLNFAQS